MPRKKKKNNPILITSLLLTLIGISFAAGLSLNLINEEPKEPEKFEIVTDLQNLEGVEYTSLVIPAVDSLGNGVGSTLLVGIMPGNGQTLVDINSLLFWVDTQSSIRTARKVAEDYTGKNLDEYNLIFKVQANASIIGGPSAGAAIAVAAIAAVQGDQLRDDVMITGSINHDGTIGPVGGIIEKASAAKDIGGTLFLVPLSQGSEVLYEQREYCEPFGGVEFCSVETIPIKLSVSGESGINVEEVQTVGDAYGYFVSQTA